MFVDRHSAGTLLVARLQGEHDAVVLGIARGGVIVAEPVARALGAPLDVLAVRKIGHPLQPELALGAAAAGGGSVYTEYAAGFSEADLREWTHMAAANARDLERRLRNHSDAVPLEGRTAIVVDDGIATSATMLCAIAAVRNRGAARVVCAVPIAPQECVASVRARCDELVVLETVSHPHFAVGRFYVNFREVSDDDVRAALARGKGAAG